MRVSSRHDGREATKPPKKARSSGSLRREMVSALVSSGAIKSPAVRRAFLAEPRERYVPEIAERDGLEAVYRPGAALVTARDRRGLPVSSSSAPGIMAPMLEALELRPGLRALEIGAGTGYNAALLARLVGEDGGVTSVEVDPGIARQARSHLADGGHRAKVVVGDGREGWPKGAPFDRIIATASSELVPVAWRDQLVEGGLVVLPFRFEGDVATQAVLALRREGETLRSATVFLGSFMGLRAVGEPEAPFQRQASLHASASELPKTSTLARLSGRRLGPLSDAERRRLLAIVVLPGRKFATVPASRADGLWMFLALHPSAVVVRYWRGDGYGVGVIGPRGASFAGFRLRFGQPSRLEAWGGPEAEDKLRGLVVEWRAAGSPALSGLSATVELGDVKAATSRKAASRKAWRRFASGDSTVLLDWRHH